MNDYEYHYKYDPSGSPGPKPPQDGDKWEAISWVIDIALIFAANGLGLFLTIAHALGHDFIGRFLRKTLGQLGTGTARGAYGTPAASGRKARRKAAADAPAVRQQERPARYGDEGARVQNVFGWILLVFGVLSVLTASSASAWTMVTAVAVALGGGALLLSARLAKKKAAQFRRCITVSGKKGVVDIARLARTMGWEGPEAERLLTEMIDRGLYGGRAYIDHERGLLVIDPEDMRDVYRAEDEAKTARASEKARAAQTEYERYVEQIRQADEEIDDEVMSGKIRQMQALTASIFQEVEEHPEKKPQIERFMNYYLPTTLKLLKSYARIEAQGVSGENMAKAKADIEGIADTLVEGYKKQLDRLYGSEAMDIAGDVSVIENMFRRDGLTGQSDFGQTLGGH